MGYRAEKVGPGPWQQFAAAGPPAEVLVTAVFREVFEVDGSVVSDPMDGRPRVLLRELRR